MATTYNKGTSLEDELKEYQSTKGVISKWELFDKFSTELQPIAKELNSLFDKYEIISVEGFMSFIVERGRFTPYINYEAFPDSINISNLSK